MRRSATRIDGALLLLLNDDRFRSAMREILAHMARLDRPLQAQRLAARGFQFAFARIRRVVHRNPNVHTWRRRAPGNQRRRRAPRQSRSEEHTSELQSLMRNSYAVF